MQKGNAFSFSVAVDPYNALSSEQSESEGIVIPQRMDQKKGAVDSSEAEMSLSTSRSPSSGTR